MYLRAKKRIKDGKEHRYWSIVESCRNLDERVGQRQVLYLGEINDGQKAAWCRTIEVLQTDSSAKQMALFPTDRQAPELDCEVVQVKLNELRLHHPRQWGACWLALKLWEQLELDRFWQPRLPMSRQGTKWLEVLKTQWSCPGSVDTFRLCRGGVRNGKDSSTVCAGVPAPDGRTGPVGPFGRGTGPRVRVLFPDHP